MAFGLFWNKLINDLKKDSMSSTLSDYTEDKADDASAKFVEESRNLWYLTQAKAARFNPDKEAAWKKIKKQIAEEVGVIRIPLRHLYRYAAAVLLLMMLYVGSVYYWTRPSVTEPLYYKYAALNGKSKVMLPDGTQVWLGSASEIIYSNRFTEENREVRVRGKAYFEVKKDSVHPFTVKVDQSEIKVYGTSFNVNNTDTALIVSLLSGKVSLHPGGQSECAYLHPGEQATLNKGDGRISIIRSDVDFDAIWAKDRLRIEEKSLGDVIKYLNQWYDAEITLSPALKGKYKYTFSITTEQLDEVLRMMARINPMEISYDKKKVSIR